MTAWWKTEQRLTDIVQLEWQSLSHMETGKGVIWMKKTGQRVEHTICPSLQQFVGEILVADADNVFPEQRALMRNVSKRPGLSVQFGRLCERLGIKDKSFHSLRHHKATTSYAKLDKEALAKKLAASLSMDEIAALLGHQNNATTKGYVH
jgi:integrase